MEDDISDIPTSIKPRRTWIRRNPWIWCLIYILVIVTAFGGRYTLLSLIKGSLIP